MPDFRPGLNDPADRALHLHNDTFFRKNGRVINAPDDLAEGAGDLIILDRNGNPLDPDGENFLKFLAPENADGWFPYLGTSPSGVNGPTKQSASQLPIGRPSFMANQPVIQGDPPPSQNDPAAAKLPRPETPILVAETVGIEGYATSTVSSPFFLKLSYGKRRGSTVAHSGLSPAVVVPPNENGQSIRAILYEDVPEGVTHIGVWLSEPGRSTATTPGPFRLQRDVEVEHYNPGSYDLTGPYRFGKKEPSVNETRLPTPGSADLDFTKVGVPAKPGQYVARVAWADENGESLPGGPSAPVIIEADSYYDEYTYNDDGTVDVEESTIGRGRLTIQRPSNPPPGATGWRAYVYNEGQWHVVYRSYTHEGNERPLSLMWSSVSTEGWSSAGDNEHTTTRFDFLVSRDLPTENTSGIEDPEDDLEQPVVFGVVRPPAGTYYGLTTETARGKESIPSRVASVTITGNQIPRLIRQDRVNKIPNAENLEVGANGLPLDHTLDVPAGGAFIQASDPTLVLQTVPGQETATYSVVTRSVEVRAEKDGLVGVLMTAELPLEGAFAGSVEAVLEELDASGAVTQTVLVSLSTPGTIKHDQIMYDADKTVSGGQLKWLSTTEYARLRIRFTGSSKNLKVRISYTIIKQGANKSFRRRKWKKASDFFFYPPDYVPPGGGEDPDPPELPTGTEVDADVPEEDPPTYEPLPANDPALVEWPEPDRPRSSGVAYESTHTFESSLPSGWEQSVSGATLTREASPTITPLVGSYSLRSYKGTA